MDDAAELLLYGQPTLESVADALLEAGARGLTGFGDWLISGLTPDHPDRQVRKDIAAQCDLRAAELRAQKGGGK